MKIQRVRQNKHSKRTEDVGEYMTYLMLTQAMGGAQYEAARRHARRYVAMCVKMNGKYVQWNSWIADWTLHVS